MKAEYYQMYPHLYTGNFYFNDSWQEDMLTNKYASLKDAVAFAKDTKIVLREQNWHVYRVSWFGLIKVRLSLKTLYDEGLFAENIDKDGISIYYNWK